MNLDQIQTALRDAALDGWLFYDHHHRDPLAASILGLDPKAHISRRWYYFIPAIGEPHKLVHRIEQGRLDCRPDPKRNTQAGRSSTLVSNPCSSARNA